MCEKTGRPREKSGVLNFKEVELNEVKMKEKGLVVIYTDSECNCIDSIYYLGIPLEELVSMRFVITYRVFCKENKDLGVIAELRGYQKQ
jgi:hypothetical protein